MNTYQLVGSVCELTKKQGLIGSPTPSIWVTCLLKKFAGGASLIGSAASTGAITECKSGRSNRMVAAKLEKMATM